MCVTEKLAQSCYLECTRSRVKPPVWHAVVTSPS